MSCDSVPLTAVGVISDFPRQAVGELENWNNWEDNNTNYKPNSIQEHIEYYRQQAMAARSISETEEEIKEDFFQDMTPRITRQTKVFVDSGETDASKPNPSRLSLAPQAILAQVCDYLHSMPGVTKIMLFYLAAYYNKGLFRC